MKFKIYHPTPQRCVELGVKFEGLHNRILMWLLGVSFAVKYSEKHFAVELVKPSFFVVESDSPTIMEDIVKHLSSNGFTVTTHPEGKTLESERPQPFGNLVCKNTNW
jgi:hypothetical protein